MDEIQQEEIAKLEKGAQGLRNLGNGAFQKGEFPQAIDYYSKALEIVPRKSESLPILLANRAFAFIKIERFEEALKDAEEALSENPAFSKAWVRKGDALFGLGRFHEAKDAFNSGLELDVSNIELQKRYFSALSCIRTSKMTPLAGTSTNQKLKTPSEYLERLAKTKPLPRWISLNTSLILVHLEHQEPLHAIERAQLAVDKLRSSNPSVCLSLVQQLCNLGVCLRVVDPMKSIEILKGALAELEGIPAIGEDDDSDSSSSSEESDSESEGDEFKPFKWTSRSLAQEKAKVLRETGYSAEKAFLLSMSRQQSKGQGSSSGDLEDPSSILTLAVESFRRAIELSCEFEDRTSERLSEGFVDDHSKVVSLEMAKGQLRKDSDGSPTIDTLTSLYDLLSKSCSFIENRLMTLPFISKSKKSQSKDDENMWRSIALCRLRMKVAKTCADLMHAHLVKVDSPGLSDSEKESSKKKSSEFRSRAKTLCGCAFVTITDDKYRDSFFSSFLTAEYGEFVSFFNLHASFNLSQSEFSISDALDIYYGAARSCARFFGKRHPIACYFALKMCVFRLALGHDMNEILGTLDLVQTALQSGLPSVCGLTENLQVPKLVTICSSFVAEIKACQADGRDKQVKKVGSAEDDIVYVHSNTIFRTLLTKLRKPGCPVSLCGIDPLHSCVE